MIDSQGVGVVAASLEAVTAVEMASDVASYDLNAIQDETLLRKMVRPVEMPSSHNM